MMVAGLMSGCAANPFAEAKVDPSSSVAEDVARMAHESRTYPTFDAIPPAPTGSAQRPLAAWGQAADQLEIAAAKVERETAPGTWTLSGTERFVARARSQAGPDMGAATTTPSSEAFAKELRERATPPPSPR